jgi:hypothetical protein
VKACRLDPDSVRERSSGLSVPDELRLVSDIRDEDRGLSLPFFVILRRGVESSSSTLATQHSIDIKDLAAMLRDRFDRGEECACGVCAEDWKGAELGGSGEDRPEEMVGEKPQVSGRLYKHGHGIGATRPTRGCRTDGASLCSGALCPGARAKQNRGRNRGGGWWGTTPPV